jgi:hypothetical protein
MQSSRNPPTTSQANATSSNDAPATTRSPAPDVSSRYTGGCDAMSAADPLEAATTGAGPFDATTLRVMRPTVSKSEALSPSCGLFYDPDALAAGGAGASPQSASARLPFSPFRDGSRAVSLAQSPTGRADTPSASAPLPFSPFRDGSFPVSLTQSPTGNAGPSTQSDSAPLPFSPFRDGT